MSHYVNRLVTLANYRSRNEHDTEKYRWVCGVLVSSITFPTQ